MVHTGLQNLVDKVRFLRDLPIDAVNGIKTTFMAFHWIKHCGM